MLFVQFFARLLSVVLIGSVFQPVSTTTNYYEDEQAFKAGESDVQIDCPVGSSSGTILWRGNQVGTIGMIGGSSVNSAFSFNDTSLKFTSAASKDYTEEYICEIIGSSTYSFPVTVVDCDTVTIDYNNAIIEPGVIYNITCSAGCWPTVSAGGTTANYPSVSFSMKKKSSSTYATISGGVTSSLVSTDSSSLGTIQGMLQYSFYPDHNDYDFRCQVDYLTVKAAVSKEFTPNVDSSKYKSSGRRLASELSSLVTMSSFLLAISSVFSR